MTANASYRARHTLTSTALRDRLARALRALRDLRGAVTDVLYELDSPHHARDLVEAVSRLREALSRAEGSL